MKAHSKNSLQLSRLGKEALLARKAYNIFSDEYEELYKDDVKLVTGMLDQFLQPIKPFGKILDVGCGSGHYVKYYLEKGFDAYGLDISEEMLTLSRLIVPANRLFHLDMHNMNFPYYEFDGISCVTSLLYTTKDKCKKILRNINSFLNDNGRLFLVMLDGEKQGFELENHKTKSAKTYVSYYSLEELIAILNESNFSIEESFSKRILLSTGMEHYLIATK